jgi:hypothetical protein
MGEKDGTVEDQTRATWDPTSVVGFYHKHAGYIDQANASLLGMLPSYRFNNWNARLLHYDVPQRHAYGQPLL